jgi:hypothetical protein
MVPPPQYGPAKNLQTFHLSPSGCSKEFEGDIGLKTGTSYLVVKLCDNDHRAVFFIIVYSQFSMGSVFANGWFCDHKPAFGNLETCIERDSDPFAEPGVLA